MTSNCYQIESCQRSFNKGYRHFIHKTPLWMLPGKTLGVNCAEVWLKLEHLQTGGSFKARGMLNRLLSKPIPPSGVIVASGGNAGIATAAAARELGVRCEVFVPEMSSAAKRTRLAALGAHVVVAGAAYADALQACLARQQETGALFTHAYDQPEVLVGAGTMALEIEQQGGVPDAVLVSVGGGGLIGGVASWTGLHEGQHFLLLDQPALHPALEHRRLAGRAQALAMHHAHAAQAGLVGFADESAQRIARVLAAKTVQVELALNAPVAPAQLAHHVRAHARAAKTQRFIGVQQRFDIKLVRQGFAHHGQLVALLLLGNGGWPGALQAGFVAGPVLGRQGQHRSDGARKQVLFGADFFCCSLAFRLPCLLQPDARLNLAPDELEVFQIPDQEAFRAFGGGRAHGVKSVGGWMT